MSDIELTAEAFAQLKKENSKLKLEANLRRSLSTQLEKQKKIADEAKQEAQEKTAELEVLSSKLSRYLSPQIYEQIFSGNQDANVTSQRKKLTVFFSDIVGFTDITEHLESEELTSLINFYLTEMSTIALKYGGTIDKYIGDAMMVFFGDPESKGERDDARSCVLMAIEMHEKLKQLQQNWRKRGFENPFEVRMGINSGYCNVGNFGSEQRLTYTIIGGEVNIAQRLEAAAPSDGILMSYESYAHAQDLVEVDELNSITMKGINREIKVFSVIRDLKTKKIAKNESKISPIKSERNSLELRIERLEKLISEMISKLN